MNELFDSLLEIVKDTLRVSGATSLPLPDIEQSFQWGLVRGTLRATGGTFGELDTLVRTGEATVCRANAGNRDRDLGVILEAEIGLAKAAAHYNYYRLNLRSGLHLTGRIDLYVHRNSATFRLALSRDKTRRVRLLLARIDCLDKISVELTGTGLLNGLTGSIVSWFVGRIKNEIKEQINIYIRDNLQDKISKILSASVKDMDLNFLWMSKCAVGFKM